MGKRLKFVLLISFIFLIVQTIPIYGQGENKTVDGDSLKTKKGWTFGALPTISYDTDVGFQYGVLANFYNYGDGSTYPEYLQSIYLEWSRTTKGSGINRFYFDSEYLIPNIRLTADVSYLTEQTMHFFGFNGYEAVYNAAWEDDTDNEYVSRVFYRHDRKIFRIMTSFQGRILKDNDRFRWLTGFAYYDNKIGSVDIDRLNEGKSDDKKLPEADGLYDKYVDWGVLKPEEAEGNKTTYLKAGLVYDSRDYEAFPTKGIWAEAVYSYAPSFLGDGKFEYSKLTLTFRQYLPLGSKSKVLAYRLLYQGTMSGSVPFHMQPHIVPTIMTGATSQGLGGSRTLRGIMRNRIVGDGIVLGNAEFRWRFLNTIFLKQQLYLGTNIFTDAGMVVDKIAVNVSQDMMGDDQFEDYFAPGSEGLHVSGGLGLKVGLNENFVVSVDYGLAADKRDGKSGLYIALNWLY
jgi:hypothetical protein